MKSIRSIVVLLIVFACAFASLSVYAQGIGDLERQRGRDMLEGVYSDLKSKYYDPTFRGIDMEAKFLTAKERIKTANSNGLIAGIIAQFMADLGDSHTRFLPPSRAHKTTYGWELQFIGDQAYVINVTPGSDAEAKGLKVGDRVVTIDKTNVTKENFMLMKYFYYTLRPQPGMRLSIIPSGADAEKEIIIQAKIKAGKQLVDLTNGGIFELIRESENEERRNRHRYISLGEDVMIWKMPQFDLSEEQVDTMMAKASKHKSLILDMRGNGGGLVDMMNRVVGNLFDRNVKIADWKGRKKFDAQVAKTRGSKAFKGEVVALIDSESASAAEILARVLQLEKRGTVIGDRSSGKVMVSRFYERRSGLDVVTFYGSSITEADLIMADGKSLENVGVLPDKLLLPTQADLVGKRDPVLSLAAELLGVKLDPEAAGKMFPVEYIN
jgi:C-terminal processing protease CtpA/Prc